MRHGNCHTPIRNFRKRGPGLKRLIVNRKDELPITLDLSSVESLELVFEGPEAAGSIGIRPDNYGAHIQIGQPGVPIPPDILCIDLFPGNVAELQVFTDPDQPPVTVWSMPIRKESK